MPLSLRRLDEVDSFQVAGSFLVERENEHNLIIGICPWLRGHPEPVEHEPTFPVVTDAGDRVAMASLRTPPHGETPNRIRIGPGCSPPERRGGGFGADA